MGKGEASVWEETVVIPTYETGAEEHAPAFSEDYCFGGSNEKVYPNSVVRSICDTKTDREYVALFLENDYLKICILPELGGRIWSAVDKTNDHEFVYHNHVVKPALAGLNGPWVMGGIEFCNRHQDAFHMVDYRMEKGEDGSCTVFLQNTDRISGVRNITKLTLQPDRAYIEITGQLYNGACLSKPSFWGVNIAVSADENTRTIFPPDTESSHRKRSFRTNRCRMENSDYDFLGSYDYERKVGTLCVTDHHTAPGKRRYTRGSGETGQAWERNLTDTDGPCVELMSGVFCGEQPEATWLTPAEEKRLVQYVMPYKGIGAVKNATREAVVGLEFTDSDLTVRVYLTQNRRVRIVLEEGFSTLMEEDTTLSPAEVYEHSLECADINESMLQLSVYDLQTNALLVTYRSQPEAELHAGHLPSRVVQIPDAPEMIASNEELFLAGRQIERYRCATRRADAYYQEGLRRDPGDIRLNNAYGEYLMSQGDFAGAKRYFMKACARMDACGLGSYFGQTAYDLALCEFFQAQFDRAYEHFFRASWSEERRSMSYYFLAALDTRAGRWRLALEHVGKALAENAHHIHARGLQAYLLRKMGQAGTALRCCRKNLEHDPFDFVSANEIVILGRGKIEELDKRMRGAAENYLLAARGYAQFGARDEAVELLNRCPEQTPMVLYYKAYYLAMQKHTPDAARVLHLAEECAPDGCFPNKLEDIAVLEYAIREADSAMARFYLGCLLYDKQQYERAIRLWEQAVVKRPKLPVIHRNLALAYYNVMNDADAARREMEKAFYLDEKDAGVFWELDQLNRRMGVSFTRRLERYEKYAHLVESRDDLYVEYITLLNMTDQYEKAHHLTMQHQFHAWEGCEGRISAQYVRSLLEMANHSLVQGDALQAERYLLHALTLPENLGEGRPEASTDNHIYYHLGLALELQEKYDEADRYYKQATLGDSGESGIRYDDRLPADRILYQGFAFLKLGEDEEGYHRFDRLIRYGEEHLEDEIDTTYERVPSCGLHTFVQDHSMRKRAHCYYLMGLGYLGYGDIETANTCFAKAVEIEPSNMECRMYASV